MGGSHLHQLRKGGECSQSRDLPVRCQEHPSAGFCFTSCRGRCPHCRELNTDSSLHAAALGENTKQSPASDLCPGHSPGPWGGRFESPALSTT